MSDFLNRMKSAAKADLKTIVLPEGEDPRTIVAATKIIEEGLAKIVILGNPDEINVPGATVIDPRNAEKHEEYAQKFAELRAKKGVTIEQARAQVMDATYFGTMMVKMGDADGLVSGACHSTADTLRPALQILKTAPGTKLVSAFFVMCTDTPQFGTDGTLIFADCGLNINPSSDELSEIAIASAHSWSTFMGNVEPHVAMLSYSTMGSAGGEVAKKVQEAVKFCKEKAPELAIDGDLQLDAAIVPTVAQLKAPGSSVAGKANVLVFPDLEAGNIGYKLVQRFAGADAYGPILQGIAKPVNDLSRGCSADDELRFLLELVDLARDVRAADEALHADAEACLLAELARLASDLHRQLIRRGQHDGLCLAAVLVELHEDGQQVGERLARARRRHAEDVRASEDFRDGLLLDGRRLLDILVGEDSCECLADA